MQSLRDPIVNVDSPARKHCGYPLQWLVIAWFLCLIPLFLFAGSTSCSRTQEARVLESAREMATGTSSWLLPRCNDVMRLKKPPLTYWMSAAAFKVGGISEWAGRVPTVLVTWLCLGACLHIAASLFGARAGLVTLLVMLATYASFRYGRLAETDAPAALGVILGTWAFWRAVESAEVPQRRLWYWLAGVGMAMALMSKGPPAAFPAIFLILWCIANRTFRPLWDFVRTGGIAVFAALGLSWYAYVIGTKGFDVFIHELRVLQEGDDHPGPFYFYTYSLMQITAPWGALVVAAVVEAIRQCRRDRRMMGLVLWFASSFVPLSLTGNKQLHYAMSIVPVVMILCGWLVDQAMRQEAPLRVRGWTFSLMALTFGVSLAGAFPAIVLARRHAQQSLTRGDAVLAGVVFVASAVALLLMWKRRHVGAIACYCAGMAVVFSALFSYWGQSLKGTEVGDVAAEIARDGEGPYLMWDAKPDLSTVFGMRRFAVASRDPQVVRNWIAANPQGMLLLVREENLAKGNLPKWLVPERRYGQGDATSWKLKVIGKE